MELTRLLPSQDRVIFQQTTFTLDVLSRYVCSTWDEAVYDPEGIDVVVLGSGMYGGYVASKIYNKSYEEFALNAPDAEKKQRPLRVLVLEAGPFLYAEHVANIPDVFPNIPSVFNPNALGEQDAATKYPTWGKGWVSAAPFSGQAYCVGGKSLFWGGWCPRLLPDDLQHWPTEVQNYLQNPGQGLFAATRPIQHKVVPQAAQPDNSTILQEGDAISAYEAIEYEIGVKPADDFIFDPKNLTQDDAAKAGLNETLHFFLNESKKAIDDDVQATTTGRQVVAIYPGPIAVQTQSFISGVFSLDKYASTPGLIASIRRDRGLGNDATPRLALLPYAHVVKLRCGSSAENPVIGDRIVREIVVNHHGEQKTLRLSPHCQVVLAMGCIESTRLALESFSLQDSLLATADEERLGRNFMFHLRADIAFKVSKANFQQFVKKVWPTKTLEDRLQQACLHIQCTGKHGQYQYQLFAASNDDNNPEPAMYRMVPDPDIQHQIANNASAGSINFILRASGEVKGGRNSPRRRVPEFGYIDLASDADFDQAFGHKRAYVQFKTAALHQQDEIWQDIHDTGHAIARVLNGGQPPVYNPIAGNANFSVDALSNQQGVGTSFHEAGTLWMGDDPSTSVTDANGHFHHITNAYCADQALFTTVGSANPALTGLSLARKVALDIVGRHSSFAETSTNLENQGFERQSFGFAEGWKKMSTKVPRSDINNPDATGTTLHLEADGIGFYYLPRELKNFELYVQWKAYRGAPHSEYDYPNSGILLHMPDPGNVNFADSGQFQNYYNNVIEVQIDDTGKEFGDDAANPRYAPRLAQNIKSVFGSSSHKTGAVYGVAPATQWAATVPAPLDDRSTKDRYWNAYRIRIAAGLLTVLLNGKKVCQANVTGKSPAGYLGFQFHSGRIDFRNLYLKEI